MKEYTWKEWKRRQCEKLGHDWAIQDCDTFMIKVCLRCGATQVFFPDETEQEVNE